VLEDVARESRRTRRELAQVAARSEEALEPLLYGLTRLGYLSPENGEYRLGNWFFERWLRRVSAARTSEARP